jgi:para-nitrobenzyl esterase
MHKVCINATAIVTLFYLGVASNAAQAPSADAVRDLGGKSWQLVQFQGGDERTLRPDEQTQYTLAFEANGRVSIRLDCNRGRSTWQSSEPHQLLFGPLALTRAMCPPHPLHERLSKDWPYVRSYTMKDGHLFLSLMADGGIYEFAPRGAPPSAAP